MPMSEKEKKQLVMLGVMLLVGLGILGYVFREKLLPQATGTAALPPPASHITLPDLTGSAALFERDDFKQLKRFGAVPIRPTETQGRDNPFIP